MRVRVSDATDYAILLRHGITRVKYRCARLICIVCYRPRSATLISARRHPHHLGSFRRANLRLKEMGSEGGKSATNTACVRKTPLVVRQS